ncbi:general secretion pathway protein M [Acidovorax sp. 107]|uniref:type II secretion system protein GspM n=1 Tax=Acidovorax sp. 107 TaxID=2135638 RepID=UPI000D3CF00B|nr:type II secretion system protein GspM [Acidovorax sp. 107]PUA98806.1 general secretion pathway protein M [Acidovorax sp. 107]
MKIRTLSSGAMLLLLMLGVVLAALAGGGYYVYDKHQAAAKRMEEMEPRHARLQGLQGSVDVLERAQAEAQGLVAQYVYPAETDANQVGNAAQQRVRNLFTAAGLQIVSSQVLPAKAEKNYDRIPLAVRAEGDLLALQGALVGLSGQTPVILVRGMSLQTIGSVRADTPQRLAVQFDMLVLRGRP